MKPFSRSTTSLTQRGLLFLVLLLTLILPAHALDYSGVELAAGLTNPSDWDAGPRIDARFDLGHLTEDFRLFMNVGYARADDSINVTCGPLFDCPKFDIDVTVISLGGEVRWQIPETRWRVGGGPVIQLIDSSSVVGEVKIDTDTEQLALEAMVSFQATKRLGFEFRVRDGGLFENLPAFDGVSILASWHF